MNNDYTGNLNDNGWKLAQDWKLGDLVANPGEHDRQDRFASDVHAFVAAGQQEGGAYAGIARIPDNGSWSNGLSPIGKDGHESSPPDYGFAQGIQAFMKAGQASGEGFPAAKINSPSGTGSDVRDAVPGQDSKANADAANGQAPGAPASPGGQNANPGTDQGIKTDQERAMEERRRWEQEKGIDPETKREYGIYWPGDGPVRSPFGRRESATGQRDTNGNIIIENHNGIDIKNPSGAPVRASEAGEVVYVGPKGKGGNTVIIKNRYGEDGIYHHSASSLRPGDRVYAGDIIGNTDMSGRTTGPHIHYGIQDSKGNFVDPQKRLKR